MNFGYNVYNLVYVITKYKDCENHIAWNSVMKL